MTGRDLLHQQIPDELYQVLSRRRPVGELRVMVQIPMIKPSHDRLGDKSVQCLNISGPAGPWVNRPFHRHHYNIVVPVTMRIVALPEDFPVLLIGEALRVQAMGGCKPVSARHTGLIHKASCFWRSTSKKLAGITPPIGGRPRPSSPST